MNRITITGNVYHQSGDQAPKAVSSGFGRMLETDEAPYVRPRATVGEEWTPVDCGWLKGGCSLVVIKNLGGELAGKQPTEDEKKAEKHRVLEVCIGDSTQFPWLVRPGEDMRGDPSDVSRLQVRCREGKTRYSVTIFPR